MLDMKLRNTLLAIVILAIAIFCLSFLNYRQSDSGFKCPNDYANADEYIMARAKWVNDMLIANPGMTNDEILEKVNNESISHNCSPSKWRTP